MNRHAVRGLSALLLTVVTACSVSEAAVPPAPVSVSVTTTVATAAAATVPSTEPVQAPAFTGTTIAGETISGSDLWRTGPVVLIFFASWCATCAQSQPEWNDLATRYAGRITVVGIVPDERAEHMTQYLTAHPVSYPVISDPDKTIWRSFGVTEPPLVALIDRGGALMRGWPGGVDAADLAATLDGAIL